MGWQTRATEGARTILTVAWKARTRFGRSLGLVTDRRVGVVVLSYNREFNIEPIVRAVLRCRFVSRVLVSNNNPDKRVADFLDVDDDRVRAIDQPERRRPGVRWGLARELLADCSVIVAIDDDIFLSPRQLRELVEAALADPDSVHGCAAMVGRHYTTRVERTVDHVVRVYVTSQAHIERYFTLIDRMTDYGGSVERIGDDIAISLAAPGPPRLHDVGRLLSCRTSTEAGIAVNQEDDFTAARDLILDEARRVRTL